ncbi:MAG: hypothetical protein MUD01_25265 [Chloroflexaceae bacterium]|nr:hypothetical protein [Chloroflexaceae bacterium]
MNKKRLIRLIQRDHALRSTLYLGAIVASGFISDSLPYDPKNPYNLYYVPAFPLVMFL